jgi:omega-amidase
MTNNKLTVSIIQTNIAWENKPSNLTLFEQKIQACASYSDIVLLPEMFTTGFSMNAHELAETKHEQTVQKLKQWAQAGNVMIVGSFIAKEEKNVYNRGFAVLPSQEIYWYDKKHLFSMSGEDSIFTAGKTQCIVPYKGWHIALAICYDLRFPVWLRNTQNAYDMLLVVANWPESRKDAFNTLLKARAIENMCYVCASNRIGTDGNGVRYAGNSQIIDCKGTILADTKEHTEAIISTEINKDSLELFRQKFPAWKDADSFTIE